jgi:hypothetical protein
MFIFRHRVNDLSALKETPRNYGVEIDVHAYGSELVLSHDAFQEGISFNQFLGVYQHAGLIVNIKEEGIEERVFTNLRQFQVENYFLLDCTVPSMLRLIRRGHRGFALRFSELEKINWDSSLIHHFDWIWCDLFENQIPLSASDILAIRKNKLKVCLVSPELQGRDTALIGEIREAIGTQKIPVDAVCTKAIKLWEN